MGLRPVLSCHIMSCRASLLDLFLLPFLFSLPAHGQVCLEAGLGRVQLPRLPSQVRLSQRDLLPFHAFCFLFFCQHHIKQPTCHALAEPGCSFPVPSVLGFLCIVSGTFCEPICCHISTWVHRGLLKEVGCIHTLVPSLIGFSSSTEVAEVHPHVCMHIQCSMLYICVVVA